MFVRLLNVFLNGFQVVKYWPAKGKSGFLVWRYLLKRDDDEPAPWTRDGKERIKKLGLVMQVGKDLSYFTKPLSKLVCRVVMI